MIKFCIVLWIVLTLTPAHARAESGRCDSVRTIANVIKNAKRLDGKAVCIKGILTGRTPIPDKIAVSAELSDSSNRTALSVVGIFGWGDESVPPVGRFDAESFRKLPDDLAPGAHIEIVYFGIVQYKRRILRGIFAQVPPDYWVSADDLPDLDVEFGILKVIQVRAVK